MPTCFFASDLHGDTHRYLRLIDLIESERPAALFLGGDLLPSYLRPDNEHDDFVRGFLRVRIMKLRDVLKDDYPRVFVILGNDDGRVWEPEFIEIAGEGLWEYMHCRRAEFAGHDVYGYSCVPPTPFLNKDWERYDVSRHVDPGCVSPEEGMRSVPADPREIRYGTIKDDLETLTAGHDVSNAVFLFHTPPYQTNLDRAGLDGRMVDHVPLDVHVGSIAVHRFIETRQPLLTLHGHIHESARITGSWRDQIGRTHMFTGAHDGPELAVVRFDTDDPDRADRRLAPPEN
ncbi:MAG: hypothetical protein AB1752_06140 [Candidatus Zixiibacteriota bacterium]